MSATAATGALAQPRASAQSDTPWIIAVTVAMAAFMEVLDTSIANVSLRHIAGSLSAGQDEANWVLTSYLVANAVVLPVSGWLATVIGRKRFYLFCLATFSISSLFCGISTSLTMLIFFRVLQGASGAGMLPTAQAILADSFPPEKRGTAFAVYGIAVVFAPAIGPTLGGWITDNYSWHWVFLINVPVGALVILASMRLIQDPAHVAAERARRLAGGLRIDYVGIALLALGLGGLQIVLEEGNREDWFNSSFIVIFAALAAAALLFVIVWEWVHDEPVINLRLYKNRNFALANVLMFMTGCVLFGSISLMPLFLQTLLGYTAMQAGMALTPGGFTIVLLMPIVGFLISRVDARYLIAAGVVLTSFGLYHTMQLNLGVDYGTVVRARILQSLGLAFLFVPINTAAFVGIPREQSNDVSVMMNLMRNLGGSVGIALAATMLLRRTQYHQSVLVSNLTPYDATYQTTLQSLSHTLAGRGASAAAAIAQAQGTIYASVVRQAGALAYNDVYYVLSIAFLSMLLLVLLMRRNKPGAGGGGGAH